MTDIAPTETSPFESFISHPTVLKNLTETMGFQNPTPIQSAVGPTILEGKNLFAGAKTGSGKTIAFLAPLAQRLLNNDAKMALVLGPTRELVLQIDEEAAKILDGQNKVVPVALYGGVPLDPQILAIKAHKPRLFLATPGRMIDFSTEGVIQFGDIEVVVLDEADRMCDMGFAPQVMQILEMCIGVKQVLLFSATLPKELSEVMNKFCPDAVKIQVDAADKSSETIKHKVVFTDRRSKLKQLCALLADGSHKGVVFTRTRNGADAIYRELRRTLPNIGILHAGFEMHEREKTIRAFRDEKINLLIATDVASRGLDVNHISHVIQYDLPEGLDDYIHRSGRSGRAGRDGISILFVESDNRDQMRLFDEIKQKVTFETIGANGTKEQKPLRSLTPNAPRIAKSPLTHASKARAVENKTRPTSLTALDRFKKQASYWLRVLFRG